MFGRKSNYTDEELITGLKMSDDRAWNFVNKEYQIKVKPVFFKKIFGIKTDFDDVYNRSLMTFYEKINKPDFVLRSELYNYFSGIFYLKCCEYLRRKNEAVMVVITDFTDPKNIDLVGDIETEDDHWLKEHKDNKLKDCIERLAERKNNVITGYYYDGLSMEQIGQKENITSDYAKSESYRAKKDLKNCMEKHKL